MIAALGGFLAQSPSHAPDITIRIIESKHSITTVKKNQEIRDYTLVSSIRNSLITTYYDISVNQFIHILNTGLHRLLGKTGFYFHCSSIVLNNKAVVFIGPQGAGKSTAMKFLSSSYTPFTDDMAIIKKKNNSQLFLYQTPLIEKNHWIPKIPIGYPV